MPTPNVLALCILLAVGACGEAGWSRSKHGSQHLAWGLEAVKVRADLLDSGRITLHLRNQGAEDVCFWSTQFPTRERARGFRVFASDGAERDFGDAVATGDSLVRLSGGQNMPVDVGITPWFDRPLSDGDCVLFEAVYFLCSAAAGLSSETAPSVERSGLAQAAWFVREGRLNLVPETEPSCRAQSLLDAQ